MVGYQLTKQLIMELLHYLQKDDKGQLGHIEEYQKIIRKMA